MTAPSTVTRQICQRCQSIDRVGFHVSNEMWRLVAGPYWENSILCLVCFGELGDEKGLAWDEADMRFFPVSYVTIREIRDTDYSAHLTGEKPSNTMGGRDE